MSIRLSGDPGTARSSPGLRLLVLRPVERTWERTFPFKEEAQPGGHFRSEARKSNISVIYVINKDKFFIVLPLGVFHMTGNSCQ